MMICSLFVVVFVLARIAPLIIKKALEKKKYYGRIRNNKIINKLVC